MAGTGMMLQETDGVLLLAAVRRLLADNGIASTAEIAERIAIIDRASPGQGARMVARAWTDPEHRALLLEDGSKAAELLGLPMRGTPPPGVLENAPGPHHLAVCTLCSCYPRAVLGYPPYWFKSAAYRSRAVRDPHGLIAELGTVLPVGTKVTAVDATADYRWLVLPMRPAGTGDWSEAQLAAIVGEGDMIGVTVQENATIVSSRRAAWRRSTSSRATTRHPANTAIDVVLRQRKRIASAHLDLDMRTSGSTQQVGRWSAAQHVGGRAAQYIPRLAMQDVTWR
jgi:hypothetical protein